MKKIKTNDIVILKTNPNIFSFGTVGDVAIVLEDQDLVYENYVFIKYLYRSCERSTGPIYEDRTEYIETKILEKF